MFNPTKKINDRLYFFNHNGQTILWCDFSKSGEDQMLVLYESALEALKEAGSSVKSLANFKSTPRSPKFTKRMREGAKWFRQEGVDIKVAVIGVDNAFTKVVMNTTMAISRVKNLRLFENQDDALEWLVE